MCPSHNWATSDSPVCARVHACPSARFERPSQCEVPTSRGGGLSAVLLRRIVHCSPRVVYLYIPLQSSRTYTPSSRLERRRRVAAPKTHICVAGRKKGPRLQPAAPKSAAPLPARSPASGRFRLPHRRRLSGRQFLLLVDPRISSAKNCCRCGGETEAGRARTEESLRIPRFYARPAGDSPYPGLCVARCFVFLCIASGRGRAASTQTCRLSFSRPLCRCLPFKKGRPFRK